MKTRLCAALLAAFAAACSSSPAAPADAGPLPVDAGPGLDAGVDAGADGGVDAGPPDAGPPDAGHCAPGGDGGYVLAPFGSISDYCLVSLAGDGGVAFDGSVVPYDLNTPLFSDYAVKIRGVFVPPGLSASYDDTNAFAFPRGTVLIKSFGFRDDFRKAQPVVDWVETRLLINTGDGGWRGYAYLWNDGGGDATLSYGGEVTPLTWIDADGGTVSTNYLVPSFGQCQQCHNNTGGMTPIGPKARNLNRSFDYATGAENQLTHWSELGILTGAPDPAAAPLLPVWNDPGTGTVEARARAYLEVNCAHCHSAGGYAHTTGLFLWSSETNPTTFGVCKPPVAAGPATGGNAFDVVPGDPAHSIMIYRMSSDTPQIAMPLIGRSVVDVEGTALVSDWITAMDGGCN